MKISHTKKLEYLDDPTFCPYCNSHNLTTEDFKMPEDKFIYREVLCKNCNKEWIEHFALSDVTFEE